MPRVARLWRRADRPGWWATIGGKQVCFGDDHAQALRAFHRAKAATRPAPAGAIISVEVAVDRYVVEIQGRVRPKTYGNYRHALQLWIDAHGERDVTSLEAEDLERWMVSAAWSESTQHAYGKAVKAWAKWCKRKKLLVENPFADVRLPGIAVREPPPAGALDELVAAASPQFRLFLEVLIETGCRPGEIATLEASRVFWDQGTAEVCGKSGPRLVGLSGRAMEILGAAAREHPTGPLLRTPRGKAWTEANIQSTLKVVRSHGKGHGVVPYHCRHAFWLRATKAGVGDIAIAKQLGHSDLKMLRKHYSHADHEVMRDTASRASAAGASSRPASAARARRPRKSSG